MAIKFKLPYFGLIVVLIILICSALLVRVFTDSGSNSILLSQRQELVTQTHRVRFYEEHGFWQGVAAAKQTALPDFSATHLIGGITPHHLLPSTLLSRFFTSIATQHPSTVVIIGPNHYEKGQFPALTSEYAWETPFGVAQPDLALIKELTADELFGIDEDVVPADHASTGSIPYVKYYLPDTQVMPIIISNRTNKAQIEQIVDQLATTLSNDTVIVAAIDFSHYLNAQEAAQKDQITAQLIANRDYDNILKLNNDYTDSPVPLTIFLKLMDRLGSTQTILLDHTNSGILLNEPNVSTTSYFSMVFAK